MFLKPIINVRFNNQFPSESCRSFDLTGTLPPHQLAARLRPSRGGGACAPLSSRSAKAKERPVPNSISSSSSDNYESDDLSSNEDESKPGPGQASPQWGQNDEASTQANIFSQRLYCSCFQTNISSLSLSVLLDLPKC